MLFVPDRNGDDVPDGPAEVVLDGWGILDRHETLNSFIWGPDGGLYGCQGFATHSQVVGRLMSGIIVEETDTNLTLQTTDERVVLAKEDIDERNTPAVSMMPEGQFDTLSDLQVCDLMAYLGSKSQVPLPPEPETESDPSASLRWPLSNR